jgi:hypothetical protein
MDLSALIFVMGWKRHAELLNMDCIRILEREANGSKVATEYWMMEQWRSN